MAKVWNSKAIAQLIRGAIVDNTLEGIDLKGDEFPDYSIAYLAYRRKKKRKLKPNLWFTGGMLKSFTVLDVKDEGFSGQLGKYELNISGKKQVLELPIPNKVSMKFGWTDPVQAAKAYYNKLHKRDMFGLKKTDLENIVNEFMPK